MSSKKIKYTAEQLERAVEFLLSGGEGKPGFSPTISVSELANGHRLTINDKNGAKVVDILNGGKGDAGHSPTIEVSELDRGYRLTINDVEGTKTVDIFHGNKGDKGEPGKSAYQYAVDAGFTGTEEEFSEKLTSKDFDDVQFDEDTRYLKFLDAKGNDVFSPVYIAGGGGGGGGASTTVVKLINETGTVNLNIAQGSTAELAFTFTSTDEDVPTGDGTCQVVVNGVTKSTFAVKQGKTTLDVTKYLQAGENTVRIKVSDIYGAYKLLNFVILVVDLRLASIFDDSIQYSENVVFKYTPYGEIEKTIHILLDGEEIHTRTTTETKKQHTVTIEKLPHGVHRLDAYITATLDEQPLESEHLVYDITCIEEGAEEVLIASVYEKEKVSQGQQVSIPYSVYNPASLESEIELVISTPDGVYSTQELTVNRSKQYWNCRNYPTGNVTFTIKCGEATKAHTLTVTELDMDIEAITNDMELYLTSLGRSNNEPDPAVWSYGDTETSFEGVNWQSTGWMADENGDSVLRLNGGARAEIAFRPFKNDWKTYGKTLEIEFAIRDVNNRDAVVISCTDGKIGFEITADKAVLKSEQSEIFCNFCEEKRVKVSFVVESRNEYRMMQVYLNGFLTGVKQYPSTDNFQQDEPLTISVGSEYCAIDLYTIRSYTNALTFQEVIQNKIYDIPDIGEKVSVYEANDLYDAYGNLLFEKVKDKIPTMVIVGDLPQSKGDKKEGTEFIFDHQNDALDFEDSGTNDVQGTSSQWYIRKNYKLKLLLDHLLATGQVPTNVFCLKADYAEATGTHNTQNANLVETLYSEKTPAQEDDPRCRTTIYGYPIVVFHQATEDSTPVFIGKYNFNFDKGSEEVFGFTEEYDVECWEFCNNDSAACNFKGRIPSDWSADFEARYPDGHKDISRFKTMHDWVVSTMGNVQKFKAEFENYFDLHYCLIYYVYTTVMLMADQRAKNMFLTYWGEKGKWQPWFYDNDTCLGINNEGHLVFDYYHEDTDTVNGANVYNGQESTLWVNFREAFADEIKECYQDLRNNGKLTYEKVLEYFITNGSSKWSESIYNEDSDYKYISMLRSKNDATNLYQVRGNGEEHLRYFIKNRLNYLDSKWYASDYANNYVSLRIYTPAQWAGVEPNAEITIVPFSNMYAGVRYKANGILQQERVDKNEEVTFTAPSADEFAPEYNDTETAVFGASEISSLGDLAPLYCGSINVSKASRLINLKVGDATAGYQNTNLTELSVGTNKLLKVLDVRNCPNLTDPLALSGCPNIEEVYATGSGITGLELSKAGYLKTLHLPGTIVNLTMSNQLYIEDFQMEGYGNLLALNIENCPAVDVFAIMNSASKLERVRLAKVNWTFDDANTMQALAAKGYKGIDENGDNVNTAQISGTCHIKTLTGAVYGAVKEAFPYMEITYDTLVSQLIFMAADGVTELTRQNISNAGDGVDPITAGTIDTPTKTETERYSYAYAGWGLSLDGTVDENALKAVASDRKVYPIFTATKKTYLIFMNEDGTQELNRQTIYGGGNGTDPVTSGAIATPSRAATAQYTYTYTGWATTMDGSADSNALKAVTEDRVLYPAFTATIRTYTVRFYNGSTLVQADYDVPYGSSVSYKGGALTYTGTEAGEWVHKGWTVDTSFITGDTDTYAKFVDNSSITRKLIDKTIKEVDNSDITSVREGAFRSCNSLTAVSLPNVTTLGSSPYVFAVCQELVSVNLSNASAIGQYNFNQCQKLETVNIANAVTLGREAFSYCYALAKLDLPKVTSIEAETFLMCKVLKALILRSETLCTLGNTSAFKNCAIAESGTDDTPEFGTGYIYVPRALIDTYKTATNWSTYASRFRVLEDYTVDGTVTGVLDESKI